MEKIKVIFVCMGNICRSPTAEGVFRERVRAAGLDDWIHIDSAGTHAYHVGASPDPRAQQAAAGRGYDLSGLVGRQVCEQDIHEFDYILAMDHDNLANLRRVCPSPLRDKPRLFLGFSERYRDQEVPDPYYGGAAGFERVLDMIEDGARGLLAEIESRRRT